MPWVFFTFSPDLTSTLRPLMTGSSDLSYLSDTLENLTAPCLGQEASGTISKDKQHNFLIPDVQTLSAWQPENFEHYVEVL